MDDFDIEDIGNQKINVKQDTIEKPTESHLMMIQEVVESKDFDNALDLFGDELLNESMNNKKIDDIDILTFEPKTVADFRLFENAIINYFNKIPNEFKANFATNLIMKLINSFNSYQIEDLLENSILQASHQ